MDSSNFRANFQIMLYPSGVKTRRLFSFLRHATQRVPESALTQAGL